MHTYEWIDYPALPHVRCFLNRIVRRGAHTHAAWEVGVVLEGQGVVASRGRTETLLPGSLLLLNPHQPHELSAWGEGALFLFLQISTRFCGAYCPSLRRLRFLRGGEGLGEETRRALAEEMAAAALAMWQGEGEKLLAVGHVCRLLYGLMEAVPHAFPSSAQLTQEEARGQRVARLLSYVSAHCAEQWSLEALAAEEGVSPAYLSAFFRENLNMSLQDYVRRTRLERAVRLMGDPGVTLTEICEESGFSSTRYLNRAFEETFGCTAAAYRRLPPQRRRRDFPPMGADGEETILTVEESRRYLLERFPQCGK